MLRKVFRPWPLWLALALCAVFLPGCAWFEGSAEDVKYQREAGSSHVAVLAVAPWEEVKNSLQPKFELQAQAALEEVLPVSASLRDLTYLGFGAKLSASVETPTATNSAGDPPSKILPERKSFGESDTQAKSPTLKSDALLRYLAATALLQEVQLLNQYLKYAPIPKNHQAYLVRLQISLMPNMRDVPCDAYTLLSFFPYAKSIPAQKDPKNLCDKMRKYKLDMPTVIPLLVSDSLEAANSTKSKEALLSLALGLSAATQGAGAGVGLESLINKLQGSLTNDLNSLFSVARVSPNTLRVRVGAYYHGNKKYVMVPRNHTVSVLLMVPDTYFCQKGNVDGTNLYVLSKTSFVKVSSGKRLDEKSEEDALNNTHEFIEKYLKGGADCQNECIQGLLEAVNNNDFNDFCNKVKKITNDKKLPGIDENRCEDMWLDLTHARCGGMYALVKFPVPAPKISYRNRVTAWLEDNGERMTTSVSLPLETVKPTCPSDPKKIEATNITRIALEIKTTDPPLYLPANKKCDAQPCVAVFNSLAAQGFKAKDLAGKVNLLIDWKIGDKTGAELFPGYYHSKTEADNPNGGNNCQLTASTATNAIMAKDAKGTLTIAFKKPDGADKNKTFILRLNGADLQATQPSWGEVAERKGELILVKKSGNITLKLTNLKECEPVTFIPVPGKVALMTLPVRQAK